MPCSAQTRTPAITGTAVTGATLSVDPGALGVGDFEYYVQLTDALSSDQSGVGTVHVGLLRTMMAEPFLNAPPPKSTGRDLFDLAWLKQQLQNHPSLSAVDVQATLLAFTAQSATQALLRHMPHPQELVVCGGGAFIARLRRGSRDFMRLSQWAGAKPGTFGYVFSDLTKDKGTVR